MVKSDILVQIYRLTEWRDDPVQLYYFVKGETGPEKRRDLIKVPHEARARTGTERGGDGHAARPPPGASSLRLSYIR